MYRPRSKLGIEVTAIHRIMFFVNSTNSPIALLPEDVFGEEIGLVGQSLDDSSLTSPFAW